MRSAGVDPAPYRHLATGERSAAPHFIGWTFAPRPEFTHRPQKTNEALAGFRDAYELVKADVDLGEYAETYLPMLGADPFARRVLERLAAVLPRPLAELRALCAENNARYPSAALSASACVTAGGARSANGYA